jgi:glycosyltransferase involved in cell wall biosynthesis
VLTGYLQEEQLARLMGSAYALVYPSLWEGFGVPVLEAMRCGVPVITSADSAMQETAKGAALYFNPADYHDIADKLMLVYKNEKLRAELAQKGITGSREFNWDKSATLLWQWMMDTMPGIS